MKGEKCLVIRLIASSPHEVTFKIIGQTYRWTEFGVMNDSYAYRFRASNGLTLKSVGSPEWRPSEDTFFVRGSKTADDNKKLICNHNDYARIEEAVREYNKKFSPALYVNDILDKDLFEI